MCNTNSPELVRAGPRRPQPRLESSLVNPILSLFLDPRSNSGSLGAPSDCAVMRQPGESSLGLSVLLLCRILCKFTEAEHGFAV